MTEEEYDPAKDPKFKSIKFGFREYNFIVRYPNNKLFAKLDLEDQVLILILKQTNHIGSIDELKENFGTELVDTLFDKQYIRLPYLPDDTKNSYVLTHSGEQMAIFLLSSCSPPNIIEAIQGRILWLIGG